MLNTYQEAAQKIGVSVKALQRMRAARELTVLKYGHSTIRITDAEIARVQARAERKALR